MTDPRPHPTTWTAPDRLPLRHELQQPAPLPADLEALVRSGHLTKVEPGCYRRAPRRPIAPPATPTRRQQRDGHVDRIVRAVLAGDGPTARAVHAVARGTSTSTTPSTEATTTTDMGTATTLVVSTATTTDTGTTANSTTSPRLAPRPPARPRAGNHRTRRPTTRTHPPPARLRPPVPQPVSGQPRHSRRRQRGAQTPS